MKTRHTIQNQFIESNDGSVTIKCEPGLMHIWHTVHLTVTPRQLAILRRKLGNGPYRPVNFGMYADTVILEEV